MARLLPLLFCLAACTAQPPTGTPVAPAAYADAPAFPRQPVAGVGDAFWQTWGDGKAELNRYTARLERYGAPREADVVLIYVTEPHDRQTWIKDDEAAGDDRVDVLKLNIDEKFVTGIYPYSVMTSVFSPVHDWGGARFRPAKLTLTVQEWCGHVFRQVVPQEGGFRTTLFSYFADESEADRFVPLDAQVLYEDALLIQLRGLDGPFNDGADWEGLVVPSLWRQRKSHQPLAPEAATITHADATRDGTPVVRYTLTAGPYTRTYDVEAAAPHRVLAWTTSDGDEAVLAASERLPYWQLNAPADTTYRTRLDLPPHR